MRGERRKDVGKAKFIELQWNVLAKALLLSSFNVSCFVLFCFSLCQNILQQDQVSFHRKTHASALSASLRNRNLCDFCNACAVSGGLPRKLAYVLDLPWYLQLAYSSVLACKPLTLLHNVERSDEWTLLCLICTDVRTGARSGSNCLWKPFSVFGVTCWAVPTARGQFGYVRMLIRFYALACIL